MGLGCIDFGVGSCLELFLYIRVRMYRNQLPFTELNKEYNIFNLLISGI